MELIVGILAKIAPAIFNSLVSAGLQMHADNLRAENDARASEVEAAKVRLDGYIRDRAATVEVMKAAQGSWVTLAVWALFAAPPGLYLAKLYVWDKMLGWGSTDPLSPFLENLTITIVAGLFGSGAVVLGAGRIASAIASRRG